MISTLLSPPGLIAELLVPGINCGLLPLKAHDNACEPVSKALHKLNSQMKISVIKFLRELESNNNREWFSQHKEDYLSARQDLISFVRELIAEISAFDGRIAGIEAERTLYRIHRDTRFSSDKTPYKNNLGANMGMGKEHDKAGYYLHVQPGGSFLAGGIYMPESGRLKELRKEISYCPEEFLKIMNDEAFMQNFGGLHEEGKLKRIPRDFDKDDPMAEYLKLKHFVAIRYISDEELLRKDLARKFGEIFKSVKPLNDFLNEALN